VNSYLVKTVEGDWEEVRGIASPVPGIVVVSVNKCECGEDLYSVSHDRSGTSILFTHSPESLGEKIWAVLAAVDWTQSVAELMRDPKARPVSQAALALVSDSMISNIDSDGVDRPGYQTGADV